MPSSHFCISANAVRWPGKRRLRRLCTALVSVLALLLLLSPSPASMQDTEEVTTTGVIGEGETSAGTINATLKLLGSEKVMPEFKLLVLAKLHDGENINTTVFTDDKGAFTIDLRVMPKELRVFAYGDFVIPDGWSNVPVATMDFETAETWELRVRPLRRVTVSGTVTVNEGKVAKRANVAFAPLDVAQDGSFTMFDEPRETLTDENGNYSLELPTGYYQVWSYWADRETENWDGYVFVEQKRGVFESVKIDFALNKGPTLEGRVIDGRNGEGVPASINLYSNQYLRQLRNFTSDGRFPDDEGPDGEEIFWPVGTFKFQASMVNPDDFTVVIRPAGNEQVLKVIPNISADAFKDGPVTWELYSDDMRTLDLKVLTHEQDLPVNQIDINLLPLKIDVPEHLSQSYSASGYTNDDGIVRFMGLATGTYEVYGARGSTFLGEIEVTKELAQEIGVKFEIPFAYGQVKLPDGEVCKNLEVFVWITNKVGREYGPFTSSAFGAFGSSRKNETLREKGMVFVPLLEHGSTFTLRFGAMKDGREFTNSEWVKIENFELVTEPFKVTVDDEKGWKIDLTLKPNEEYKKYESDSD